MNYLHCVKNCFIPLSENKTLEWQFYWDKGTYWSWFDFSFRWTRKQDHAGPTFNFEIYKFMFMIDIHDNRHWDNDTNDWCVYNQTDSIVEV